MTVQLFCGDCLEIMKDIADNSIDAIITDPPYKVTARGSGGNSGGMFQKKIVNSGNVFKENSIDIIDWLPELYRVLKDNSHCYIMTNNKNISRYLAIIDKSEFHFIKNLIWVKDNKIMGQSYMSQFEYIIMMRKGGHRKINNCGCSDVMPFRNNKSKDGAGKPIHDTEKPVDLIACLIANSTDIEDIVLDPFMGIGTTGVACLNTNRNFIGIEKDEKYFEVAKNRIAEAEKAQD